MNSYCSTDNTENLLEQYKQYSHTQNVRGWWDLMPIKSSSLPGVSLLG